MIVIDNSLPQIIVQNIYILCINMQKQFDISPIAINTMINISDFKDHCLEINNKEYSLMEYEVDLFKKYYKNIVDSRDDNKNRLEFTNDNCGKIYRIFNNGYTEYCNIHKYEHVKITDHQFINKTYDQILNEYYYRSIHRLYINYINRLYISIYNFMRSIIDKCLIETLPVSQWNNSYEKKVRDNPYIFKKTSMDTVYIYEWCGGT